MKKTLLAVTLAALTSGAATSALAADPKAPAPDFEISGNFALVSDYRFRGVTQSNKNPAIQGGIDFSHKSGFYAGNWNSSVSEWASPVGSGIESDLYAGYSTELGPVSLDAGFIYYYYANAKVNKTATGNFNPFNTREIYVGVSYGPLSLKTSRTMSERYFGLGKNADVTLTTDAKGSMYYDLSLEQPLNEKTSLTARAGMLKLANKTATTKSIYDYSVGVNYDLNGWGLGLAYTTTTGLSTAAKTWFTSGDERSTALYKSAVAVSLSKTF